MGTLQRKISDFELNENIRKLQAYKEKEKKGLLSLRPHQQYHSLLRKRSHLAEDIHECIEKIKTETLGNKTNQSQEEKDRQNELKEQELKKRLEKKKEEVFVLREKIRSFDYQLDAKDRKIDKYVYVLEFYNFILIS